MEIMSSLRWLVKNKYPSDTIISMHDTESKAVKAAIYLNDIYQTDTYYVEKFDKRNTTFNYKMNSYGENA
jgi:hypothetical protein